MGKRAEGIRKGPLSWIGDARGHAVLSGGRQRRKTPAEAPAVNDQLLGMNLGKRQREIDDRAGYRLPVRSQGDVRS